MGRGRAAGSWTGSGRSQAYGMTLRPQGRPVFRSPASLTFLLQLNDSGLRSEGIPGCAVVACLEIDLHHIVYGQGGQHPVANVGPFHGVALQSSRFQEVLLPAPGLVCGWKELEEEQPLDAGN